MAKRFQDILVGRYQGFSRRLVIVKNVDGFLAQPETRALLELNGIKVFDGSNIAFRLFFELEFKTGNIRDEKVLYLNNKPDSILEDISALAGRDEFRLEEHFPEYHAETLLACHHALLDHLYAHRPLRRLDKRQTLKYILEHYYGIDADNFSSKEAVLAKWLEFYQRDIPVDQPVKAYFQELSAGQLKEEITVTKAGLLQYLQQEWQKCADGQSTTIDFRHPHLQNALSAYFFKGWLAPLEDPSGNCREIGIPYAIKETSQAYTAESLAEPIKQLMAQGDPIDWAEAGITAGQSILRALESNQLKALNPVIQSLNYRFQQHLDANYKEHILPSNPFKRPQAVSKILPHLKSHYGITDKVALLVVDGMAFWQYHLLKQSIAGQGLTLEEHAIYSWIPSVTYLSRQAIFRGSTPGTDYVQSPANEKKLWEEYWKKEGLPPTMIRYDYQQVEPAGLQNISRLAVVYTELDDKMHSSSDYEDLYALTQNWITRSQVAGQIHQLTREGFTVYLTTDHGNLEAAGWRNLKGKEKFGASKSRSKRHLEYAESWLADEFLASNPELAEVVGREQNTLYLRDDRSFSNQSSEVTHGGSHFLEVLIPFVKISANGR